jgi:hypothetical protein
MRAAGAVLALALAAAGCSNLRVATDWDRDADLTALRRFDWMPLAPDEPDPFGSNTLVKKRVLSAIERELAAKSVSRAEKSPDFLVAVHGYARDRIDVTTWPSWGYCWHGGDRVEVWQYTEGTLVLDFVRPESKDLLWRGVATSVLDSSSGSPERVDEAVHKLLESFPPPPSAK